MEAGILKALVPTEKGTLQWKPTQEEYELTYTMGSEVITKSVTSIALAVSWFSRMEASAKAGSCSKGVVGMGKPTVAAEAGLGRSSSYTYILVLKSFYDVGHIFEIAQKERFFLESGTFLSILYIYISFNHYTGPCMFV